MIEKVKFTWKMLDAGKSSAGAWNKEQMAILSRYVKIKKGWQSTLMGKMISKEAVDRFISLKNSHLSQQQVNAAKQKPRPIGLSKAKKKYADQRARASYGFREFVQLDHSKSKLFR